MYLELETQAKLSVQNAIKALGSDEKIDIKFEQPPNPEMGDLATNVAFQLASKLKKSPLEISEELLANIELASIFDRVESKGPYLNFFVNHEEFFYNVLESVQEEYGQLTAINKKIIVEHTSANPNGPLHIGHIRNAILGDSLARILKAGGYDVETQYYVNDMGRQIAMIVWGLQNLKYKLDENEKPDVAVGELYFQVNQELKKRPEIKLEIDSLLKVYEKEDPKHLEVLFKGVVDKCLLGVKKTSQRLHIHHDNFIWESKFVRNGSVARVLDGLKEYTHENEVLYLDLNQYGIEKELILLRSDGTSLYSTRDLAYHLEKATKADEVLDILGSDHKLALEQLSIALELLGEKKPEVIFYEFITLPEGSMSTRRGVFISVDELMDEAVARALNELERRRPELNQEERKDIAEIIGVGAIRYFIAKLSPEKHIVFKWEEALSFERGCASIQYAHARACKLLEKANTNIDSIKSEELKELDPLEIELLKTIARFTSIIKESSHAKRVHPVAQYSLELAGNFNKFYKTVPVIGSEKENLRLLIVDKSRIALKNSLKLLGIEAPYSM